MRGLASWQRLAKLSASAGEQAAALQRGGDQLGLELGLVAVADELQRQLADARQLLDGLHLGRELQREQPREAAAMLAASSGVS
jgi:hypothetical protein